MYFNVYKANAYNYTDYNFNTLKEVERKLHISKTISFTRDKYSKLLFAKYEGWTITLHDGIMPDKGAGFIDMIYESGATEYIL